MRLAEVVIVFVLGVAAGITFAGFLLWLRDVLEARRIRRGDLAYQRLFVPESLWREPCRCADVQAMKPWEPSRCRHVRATGYPPSRSA
jgi:hypothetical protein